MPLAPCSSCTAGDHAACDAAARPYCGCRQAQHQLDTASEPAAAPPVPEPVEAPMGEVLDAAARAPRSEVATEQEAVAAEPGAVAPVVQSAPAVDPATVLGIDPAAQAAGVLGALADAVPELGTKLADLGPSDEPDEALSIDAAPGVVGLVDVLAGDPTIAEAQAAARDAGLVLTMEADAGPSADTPAAEGPGSIIMAEPRSPRLHVSLWDGDRACFDPAEDGATQAELAQQAVAAENDAAFLAALKEAMDDDAHGFDGTPEAPYRCRCGKDLGTLNKLGSHLGIQSDDEAMAELGKLTAGAKQAATGSPVIADETFNAGEGIAANDAGPLPPDGSTVTVEKVEVLLPGTTEPLAAELVTTTPAPGGLADLGPSDEDDDPTSIDPAVGLDRMAIADAVRVALVDVLPADIPGMSPWRIIVVNGADGWAREVSYTDEDLPTALADELLEHYGYDPTPLPEGVQQVLAEAATAAAAPAPAPPPAPVQAPPALTVGAAMPARQVATPTQIQVARVTTSCAKGNDTIEEGQMIGHLDGYGWVHLACATAG